MSDEEKDSAGRGEEAEEKEESGKRKEESGRKSKKSHRSSPRSDSGSRSSRRKKEKSSKHKRRSRSRSPSSSRSRSRSRNRDRDSKRKKRRSRRSRSRSRSRSESDSEEERSKERKPSKWDRLDNGVPSVPVSRMSGLPLGTGVGHIAHGAHSKRIYVGNLDYRLVEANIHTLFHSFGQIAQVEMPKEGGHSKGFCFLEYTTEEAAKAAMEAMNGYSYQGRPLRIGPCTPGGPVPGGGSFGFGGGAAGHMGPTMASMGLRGARPLAALGLPPGVVAKPGMGGPALKGFSGGSGGSGGGGGEGSGSGGKSVVPLTMSEPKEKRDSPPIQAMVEYELDLEHPSKKSAPNMVFFANVVPVINEEQFKSFVGEAGPIKSIQFQQDSVGKGFGVAVFEDATSAATAVSTFNNFVLVGEKMIMEAATHHPLPPPLDKDTVTRVLRDCHHSASKVLVLRNLVEEGEDTSGVTDEVKEEAQQYGPVEQVKMESGIYGVDIFLRFTDRAHAAEARKAMHRRAFGGRTVYCHFYPDKLYSASTLNYLLPISKLSSNNAKNE